mmetsp:Transcript_4532/g.13063  ORF Transcript_4532/g.13063 Transcript_4532/m.13063 type:complete len:207 (-) Transcript_4532:340-960(-)
MGGGGDGGVVVVIGFFLSFGSLEDLQRHGRGEHAAEGFSDEINRSIGGANNLLQEFHRCLNQLVKGGPVLGVDRHSPQLKVPGQIVELERRGGNPVSIQAREIDRDGLLRPVFLGHLSKQLAGVVVVVLGNLFRNVGVRSDHVGVAPVGIRRRRRGHVGKPHGGRVFSHDGSLLPQQRVDGTGIVRHLFGRGRGIRLRRPGGQQGH